MLRDGGEESVEHDEVNAHRTESDLVNPRPARHRRRSAAVLVGALEDLVEELTALDPAESSGAAAAELSLRLHRAMDRTKAQQIGWLGRVEAEGAWHGTGARTLGAWLARTHDIAFHESSKLIAAARAWRDTLPTTGAAARSGRVSTAKGALLATVANTPERTMALTTATLVEANDRPDGSAAANGSTTDGPTGEEVLLALAESYGVREFQRITRRFAHVADPDADDRGYREALAREHFDLAKTTGGYHLSGFLTLDHGQVLKTALRGVGGVPAAGDTRTATQRRAAELVSLGKLTLDKGLTGNVGTVRPHLSVHVSQTELEHLMHRAGVRPGEGSHESRNSDSDPGRYVDNHPGSHAHGHPGGDPDSHAHGHAGSDSGSDPDSHAGSDPDSDPGSDPHSHADSRGPIRRSSRGLVNLATLVTSPPAEWEDGTGPIPAPVLQRIAADCDVTRVVFGPDSQVIDVGRAKRTFAGHLRRAVVARDRECVVDGCGAPAFMSQVHHARARWADGGTTQVNDGALVCAFHNQWLEDARVPMRMVRARDGSSRWQVGTPGSYRPDGSGHFPQDDPGHPDHVPRTDTS